MSVTHGSVHDVAADASLEEDAAPDLARNDLESAPGSGRSPRATLHRGQVVTPEGVVDRFRIVSHVVVLPPAQWDEVRRGLGDPRLKYRDDRPAR